MYTYLLVNLLSVSLPLMFCLTRWVRPYVSWRAAGAAIVLVGVPFIIWDSWFTKAGVWAFNSRYILGIKWWDLPLEEWLFFAAIPFACLFIYFLLARYVPVRPGRHWRWLFLFLTGALWALVMTHPDRLYTQVVAGALGTACLLAGWSNPRWLGTFTLMFGISLVPFVLVNGILTNGLPWVDAAPIVSYDDSQNLGIRVLGIPVEDALYSMLLLLGNVAVYEWLKGK